MTVIPAAPRRSQSRSSVSTSSALDRSSSTSSSGACDERARRRQPLPLAARTDAGPAARSTCRALGHLGDVGLDRPPTPGRASSCSSVIGPSADVVAHRVGDQLGHLREEGRVRRHEERRPVVDRGAVPATSPVDVGLPRQPEQRPQQGALAGADRPGDRRRTRRARPSGRCRSTPPPRVHARSPRTSSRSSGTRPGRSSAAGRAARPGRSGACGRDRVVAAPSATSWLIRSNATPACLRRRAADRPSAAGRQPAEVGGEERQLAELERARRDRARARRPAPDRGRRRRRPG